MTDTPPVEPEAAGQPEATPEATSPTEPQASEATPDPAAEAPTEPSPAVAVGGKAGGDTSIGGDGIGRNVIDGSVVDGSVVDGSTLTTSPKTAGTLTIGNLRVGLSELAVLRLVIVVGALVFITAACFLSAGLAVGTLAFQAFVDRPLVPTPAQADAFQQRLDALDSVQSGERFTLVFDEAEFNAFVRYMLGPQIGFAPETGEARLINDNGTNMIAVRGEYGPLGNLAIVTTFTLTDAPGAPLQLTGVAARLFGGRDGGPGWVLVPVDWLRTVEVQVNALIGNVQLEQAVVPPGAPDGAPWEVSGEAR